VNAAVAVLSEAPGVHSRAAAWLAPCVALAACTRAPAPPDAPGSAWSLGPTMPRRALDAGVTALGVRLIVAGGYDTGASEGLDVTTRVDSFDTTTQRWSSLPDAPVRWTEPNLASLGATLFLLGGLGGSPAAAHGEAFALDPITQRWTGIASMDAADARGASAVLTAPGRIYLLGGASASGALATCLEYDLAADLWTHLPDLPAPRAHPAAMRLVDGTLIVAGGLESLDASAPRSEVWALAPPGSVPRVWQPRTKIPPDSDLRGGCAYGVVLGELLCAGGEGGQTARRVVASYAPYLDQWTAREAMPVDRAGTPGVAVGGRFYVPGGAASLATEPTDTLYVYEPLDTAPR